MSQQSDQGAEKLEALDEGSPRRPTAGVLPGDPSGEPEDEPTDAEIEPLPPLAPSTRLLLLVLGWLLILVGVAGLVLPGLQGVLTLLLGAAALSLVSQTALRLLHRLLRRWPRAWQMTLRLRRRIHHWISGSRTIGPNGSGG